MSSPLSEVALNKQSAIPVLAVVGVGLIGGSFAAALKAAGAVGHVIGVGRDTYTLQQAKELNLIDEAASLEDAMLRADVVMLATPVRAIGPLLKQIAPLLRPGTIVTDSGSTKLEIVQQAHEYLGVKVAQFVAGHPIAGAEQVGPQAANARLYKNCTVVLTPVKHNTDVAVARVTHIWELCGARVITMPADAHDKVLASVSHVPHLLSSVFMGQVAAAQDSDRRLLLAGSGFRDFTRIAAGSSEVWRDIFLANRAAVLSELQEVKAALEVAELALENADANAIENLLERAAVARRFWGSRTI